MTHHCGEVSVEYRPGWKRLAFGWQCPNSGHRVSLSTPAGRPPAEGGPYCDEHGGESRARAEAERDWNLLAPESVGDAAAVHRAGCAALRTPEAYVVVRPENGRWLAWRGLGSMLAPVPNPAWVQGRRRGGRRHRRAPGHECGRFAFPDRDSAIEAARAAWDAAVRSRVAEITAARGGTLGWGVPIDPLREPIIIELGEHGSAWDVASRLARRSPPGVAWISGLRPSGEAA